MIFISNFNSQLEMKKCNHKSVMHTIQLTHTMYVCLHLLGPRFLLGLALIMQEKALTSSESSSVVKIFAAFLSASRSFATRNPAIDQVWNSRDCFPMNLAFLVSQYSGHLSLDMRFSATETAFAAISGLFIFMHATVSCTTGFKYQSFILQLPSLDSKAISFDMQNMNICYIHVKHR